MKRNSDSDSPEGTSFPRTTNLGHYLLMPPGSSSGLFRTTNEPIKILPAPPRHSLLKTIGSQIETQDLTNNRSILKKTNLSKTSPNVLVGTQVHKDMPIPVLVSNTQSKKFITVPAGSQSVDKNVKVITTFEQPQVSESNVVYVTTQNPSQCLSSKFIVTKPPSSFETLPESKLFHRPKIRVPHVILPVQNGQKSDSQTFNSSGNKSSQNVILLSALDQFDKDDDCPELTPIKSDTGSGSIILHKDNPKLFDKFQFRQKLVPVPTTALSKTQGLKHFLVPVRTSVSPGLLEGTDLNKLVSATTAASGNHVFQITNGKIISNAGNMTPPPPQLISTKNDLLLIKSCVSDVDKEQQNTLMFVQEGKEPASVETDLSEGKEEDVNLVKEMNEEKIEVIRSEEELKKILNNQFDPISIMYWIDKVGELPMSDLKFKISEHGLLVLAEEDDIKSSQAMSENYEDANSLKGLSDKMLCCHVCGTYGLGCEFFNSKFCSQQCHKFYSEEKAETVRKMLERQEKKMRIKEQKHKLLQQRATLDKLGLYEAKVTIDEKIKLLRMEKELLKITEGDSDFESGSCSSQNIDGLKPYDRKLFSWTKYLNFLKAKSAPYTLFKDPFPTTKNYFKVGMKLEGIDPVHPSLFCVLSVSAVVGYRIKLHFDGYSDIHDFWVNANSSDIFHPGWCELTNHKLCGPRGYAEKNFNWGNYLRFTRTMSAPKSCFVNNQERNIIPSGFRVGMKLEAVDKRNTNLVCVASIADVLDNRILIHFDSWDDIYDYWADGTSPYIHPVGWCKENGHKLMSPNEYSPGTFVWEDYLRETRSTPVPARAFKPRPLLDFRRGMKLECEDKRNPVLIRVATIVDTKPHMLKIKFDGWPDQYSYWLDDDDPGIHPACWCEKTGHQLEPPPSEYDVKSTAICPTPGCRGLGHAKRTADFHSMSISCPYSNVNYQRDDLIPDRFCSRNEYYEVKEGSLSKGTKPRPGVRRKAPITNDDSNENKVETRGRKRKIIRSYPNKTKKSKTEEGEGKEEEEREETNDEPEEDDEDEDNETASASLDDPMKWSSDQVSMFVESDRDYFEKGKLFLQHKIDGEAFLMLTQNDLVQILNFKLGPAIVLYNRIKKLREQVLDIRDSFSS